MTKTWVLMIEIPVNILPLSNGITERGRKAERIDILFPFPPFPPFPPLLSSKYVYHLQHLEKEEEEEEKKLVLFLGCLFYFLFCF